jgi:signal transduction histidine kinase/CheY-like chemotaxis protein
MQHLLSLALHHDQDVVTARQHAAHVSQLLGFDGAEQTRIATAVSEMVRNACRYASGGQVTFAVDEQAAPQRLVVRVSDTGPGIARLDDVLAGRFRSSTGMGLGIVGARRLMDDFSIESSPAGTVVVLEKWLSPRQDTMTAQRSRQIAEALSRKAPAGLIEEIQQQNQQLLRALDELQRKQQELVHLNRELEDTNRGVVALYAELDENADHLRRADDLKSRFLSNMTHEFRTPVNSIIGLSNLLLEDARQEGRDAPPEVVYIRQAAEQLSELVNDLLDLAKVEAGKTVVRTGEFEVQNLFGALRGMLRPLLLNQSVSLVFGDADGLPPLSTDEGKVSQILRNLISNALKFTERGEVRVSAAEGPDRTIVFTVSDTGIGIAPEHQSLIFEEFTQLENRLQRSVRGTGLGLPLSRRLAELLGGTLTVESDVGIGSAFTLTLPIQYAGGRQPHDVVWTAQPDRLPVLIVEDALDAQYVYEKVLRGSPFQPYPARTIEEAGAALDRIDPSAIILDVPLGDGDAWDLLRRLREDPKTARTPVVVVSSAPGRTRALAQGANAFLEKPVDRRVLLDTLNRLRVAPPALLRVLVIDDEDMARYIVRQCLGEAGFEVAEARNGMEGLARIRRAPPDVVILDLVMPGLAGTDVLHQLHEDPDTRDIPVVVVTSQVLDGSARGWLLERATRVLSKADVSRAVLTEVVRAAVAERAALPRPAAPPSFPL